MRNRTRAAIIEAATALLREGRPPTVAEAAERALVSRATAYRYFPTQESLLLDVANVEALLEPVEELVASFPADDPAQRLAALAGTFTQAMLSEALIRTGERIYMDTWLANQSHGNRTPVRAGRRMRYIDEALRPLGERLGEPARRRLRSALALALGTHAVIAMKDSAGVDDDEEIAAALEWAASALLRSMPRAARSVAIAGENISSRSNASGALRGATLTVPAVPVAVPMPPVPVQPRRVPYAGSRRPPPGSRSSRPEPHV